MSQDPNYPPGVAERDISGTPCPQCGACGCECEDDNDPRSFEERVEEERQEHDLDIERSGG